MLNEFKNFRSGDKVAVIFEQEGYDGEIIKKSDKGNIQRFVPKVRIIKRIPIQDGLEYFAYIVFERIVDKLHNNKLIGGVNLCNLIKIEG